MISYSRSLTFILLLITSAPGFAEQAFWRDIGPDPNLVSEVVTAIQISDEVTSIRYFDSDEQALRNYLDQVPLEQSGDDSYTIRLPMPDGSLANYSIVESPIMEVSLVAKYPEITSYIVYGVDDPGSAGRVDLSPKGFRGMVYTSQGRVFIDPDEQYQTTQRYIARTSLHDSSDSGFQCRTNQLTSNQLFSPILRNRTASRISGSLLEYRLAVSATQQYVQAPNVNVSGVLNRLSDALAEINTAINRVNVIYQRDLGIKLVLVGNNDLIIDVAGTSPLAGTNGQGQPLNNDGFSIMPVNQAWIDSQIGNANYDIGHVFTTGGGGVAKIRAACNDLIKAQGVTGLSNPVGEVFYIDFVAHEIGHQFGAEHTFNGTSGSCFGNRSLFSTTFEPGSGSTIMAYAGICGAENIQLASDATFHAGTIEQIDTFVGGAGSCNTPVVIAPANTDPTAAAGVDQVIPINTAFLLQGSGTDADLDTLSYQWDQMDAGTATASITLGDDLGDNALFRSYLPQPTGNRDFPALGTQVDDGPLDLSEALPCTSRIVNFRLTVRDNKSGQATDDISLTVDGTSGPFRITSFNTTQTIFITSPVTINWDVANTNTGAVSCANVDVDLLTFSADHKTRSGPRFLDSSLRSYFPRHQATSGRLMDS